MAERNKIYDVAIIGAGPAGLTAASWLVREDSGINVVVIDGGRGGIRKCPILHKNHHCTSCRGSCQIIEGVGGACSAVSCGIFSTYPAGSGREALSTPQEIVERESRLLNWLGEFSNGKKLLDQRVEPTIAEEIVRASAAKNIRVKQYLTYEVHGGDLDGLMFEILGDATAKGVNFRFDERVTEIRANGHYTLETNRRERERVHAKNVVFGTGRAGGEQIRKTWECLGICPTKMSGYVGIRFEDRANEQIAQLRRMAADPKFIRRLPPQKEIRLFCFCPEGKAVVMNLPEHQSMEGCVEKGTGWGNYSAQEKVSFSMDEWQRWNQDLGHRQKEVGGGTIIGQSWQSLRNGTTPRGTRSSIHNGWSVGSVGDLLGHAEVGTYAQFLDDFHAILGVEPTDEAHVFAPELHIWPSFGLPLSKRAEEGIYIVGDVSGDSRGILQAMDDGRLAALAILGNLR